MRCSRPACLMTGGPGLEPRRVCQGRRGARGCRPPRDCRARPRLVRRGGAGRPVRPRRPLRRLH
eukprot:6777066-Alexandrium_andersonii.AAC.1